MCWWNGILRRTGASSGKKDIKTRQGSQGLNREKGIRRFGEHSAKTSGFLFYLSEHVRENMDYSIGSPGPITLITTAVVSSRWNIISLWPVFSL